MIPRRRPSAMGNEELRRKLDALIHPLVKKKALSLVGEYRRQGCPLCVMEAALLIEEHYDEICDELWYIYASEKTRMARLIASRGYDEERISRTFRRQLSEGEFRKHAHRDWKELLLPCGFPGQDEAGHG